MLLGIRSTGKLLHNHEATMKREADPFHGHFRLAEENDSIEKSWIHSSFFMWYGNNAYSSQLQVYWQLWPTAGPCITSSWYHLHSILNLSNSSIWAEILIMYTTPIKVQMGVCKHWTGILDYCSGNRYSLNYSVYWLWRERVGQGPWACGIISIL